MRLIATVLAVGLLSACTQGYYVKHRSPISVTKHVKRLNTTACHDKDDWYLDGYRVGKDFQAQSQSQLNKRINFCGRRVPEELRTAWFNGFDAGCIQSLKMRNKETNRDLAEFFGNKWDGFR